MQKVIAVSILSIMMVGAGSVLAQQNPTPTTGTNTNPVAATNKLAVGMPRPDLAGWMASHERFVRRAKQGNVDLVFFGDSITHWWSHEDFINRYGRTAANFGIGGDQIQHVLWRVQNGELDGIAPKVAVIAIGTNNVAFNSPDDISDAIAKLVSTIQEKSPTTKVLVQGIFPRGWDGKWQADAIAQVNSRLAKLDNGNTVRFIDIGAKLRQPDGTLSHDVYSDGTHLLPDGYTIWADAIQPTLQELLGKDWQPVRSLPQAQTLPAVPGSAAPGAAPNRFVGGAMKNLNQVPSWGNAKVELVPDGERGKILKVQFGHINKSDWYGGFGLGLQAPTAGDASDVVGFGFPVKGDGSYPNSSYLTLTTDKGVGYITGNISAIFEDEAWHDVVLKASDFKLDPDWVKNVFWNCVIGASEDAGRD